MLKYIIFCHIFFILMRKISTSDVLGCGGFVKSHVQIDFSQVEVKLLTKQGILRDKTTCAPNNGYYFLPIYDKGEYVLELNPPPGWSFSPIKVDLKIDRVNDLCSKGIDINFNFKGFGIAGRVESFGDSSKGPEGVSVELISENENRKTITMTNGMFSFTPVYPGKYVIKAFHPRWKFIKDKLKVEVTEGNTELPPNSVIVHGYRLTGFARSEGEAVSNTTILLYSKNPEVNKDIVLGCNISNISRIDRKPLCHVTTDSNGFFSFESISVGNYYITTYFENDNIDVLPKKIEFSMKHSDLELEKSFEVVGFSVTGKILETSSSLKGIPDVKIFMDSELVTKTDENGIYKLEKLQTGLIKIRAESDNVLFSEVSVKVNPNIQTLPAILPYAYKICGRVNDDQSQTITISKVGSTFLRNIPSNPQTGIFCDFLPSGTYEVQVQSKKSKDGKFLQFYPVSQKIEVLNEDNNVVVFSQLKATVVGKVQCLQENNCKNLEVLLTPTSSTLDKAVSVKLRGKSYEFTHILPGSYRVSLSANRFCWVKDSHDISINSIAVNPPPFIQNGYSVKFASSHNTKVSYEMIGGSIKDNLEIKKGESVHCLPKDGTYIFQHTSCHTYANNNFSFNTEKEPSVISLEALAHMNQLCISSDSNYGPLTALIDKDGEKIKKGPLPYENGCYILEILLETGAKAIIFPQSEIYYFKPEILTIRGKNDCSPLGKQFEAIRGHVFKGRIIPALPGTLINLEDDNGESLTTETDKDGCYKFPPLDRTKKYTLTAKRDSYQLVGPLENGDFTALKLAQVIVEVLDETTGVPLQGTLLSLSGGLNYRSNLQTDMQGKLIFHSLNPSEYFLKPMMKEYNFEPPSKILNVEEGESINVTLIGKRVAYSAFGIVTSLNKIPLHNTLIEAIGIGNCSHFSEETTTEINGNFRIRGLQPYCMYHLRTKIPSMEHTIPEFIEIKDITSDETNLHLIVLHPKKHTKVLVKINSNVPEYGKMLKLCVYVKGQPQTPIQSIRLENHVKISKDSNLVAWIHLPSFSKDGKTYILQLESTSPQNLKWLTDSVAFVANTSFKYAQLEFSVESNVVEQQLKQTPVWSFILIIASLVIAYNVDSIVPYINQRFNIKLGTFGSILKTRSSVPSDYPANNSDIDQIVQNINAVKRKGKKNS